MPANGSGVVHTPGGGGGGAGSVGVVGADPISGWFGGSHPPFRHTHVGAGCTVVHGTGGMMMTPPMGGVGGGGGVVGVVGGGAVNASGCPGGTQPPLTQTQPGAGAVVVQLLPPVGGDGGAGGFGVLGVAPTASGCPGGTHPPLMHTQSDAGGSVTHAPLGPLALRPASPAPAADG